MIAAYGIEKCCGYRIRLMAFLNSTAQKQRSPGIFTLGFFYIDMAVAAREA